VHLFSEFSIGEPAPFVPGTRPTHTDESVGVEYELRHGFAMGLTAVYRELRDVIENESFDDAFVVGNPGGTHTVNPATGEPLAEPAVYDEPVHRTARSESGCPLSRRLLRSLSIHPRRF
jgi:hypothetical protein